VTFGLPVYVKYISDFQTHGLTFRHVVLVKNLIGLNMTYVIAVLATCVAN